MDGIQVTDGEPSEKILIIARNIRYARAWCSVYHINPESVNVRIATKVHHIPRMNDFYYVDLGTDSQVLRGLLEQLKSRGFLKPLLTPNI